MVEAQPQPDLDPAAMGQLIDALSPVMPALERLVEVWKHAVDRPKAQKQPATYTEHPEQESCDISFQKVRQHLPGIHQGRSRRENLTGLHADTLHEVKDRRRFDVFVQYEACREIFTSAQWEVIYLYWNQGLTQAEIAESLGLKRSAVSGRLARAAAGKQRHDRRMRQERLEHLKKMQKELDE